MDDPIAWFQSLPPITRTWLGTATGISLAVTLDFIPSHQLLFDWVRVRNDLELWRLITSFSFCGGQLNEFHALILLYLIHNHMKGYESNPFPCGGGRRADAAFAFCFCVGTILISYPIINRYGPMVLPERYAYPVVLYPLFTRNLVNAILYLWSRRNPNARINLNFIPVQGRYLPFAYIGFSLALGNRLNELVHGIIVGHIYFYLVEVVPTVLNRRILTTPRFLVDLLGGGGGAADYVVVDDFIADDSDEDVGLPPPPPSPTAEEEREIFRRNDGATDAHIAAKTGSLQALRVLARTDEGAQMLHSPDRNGWTPIHEAVRLGDLDVVDFLIAQQVDFNARTQREGRGFSPLWLAQATHGPDHPVTRRLRELGAEEIDPEWEGDR